MEYTFFGASVAACMLLLAITVILRKPGFPVWIIGVASVAFSMVFELTLGEIIRLYYYIAPMDSVLYLLLASLFIYTPLNIVFVAFLPENMKSILIYTAIWIAGMLIFEYAGIMTGTLVFTGWNPVPWSPLTYVFSYIWIILLYRYLVKSHRYPATR